MARVIVGVWGDTPLLECDAPSTGKGVTIKKKIIKTINKYNY